MYGNQISANLVLKKIFLTNSHDFFIEDSTSENCDARGGLVGVALPRHDTGAPRYWCVVLVCGISVVLVYGTDVAYATGTL